MASGDTLAVSITPGGVVPIYSSATTIQAGEWISIYGKNLATRVEIWNGDFPTTLGGTSVTINNKPAFINFVAPTQIDVQAPDDTAMGTVPVVVTTPTGSATSTVTLGQFGPAFNLIGASRYVAGIVIRNDGSGQQGGGTYDFIGPTGDSLGFPTSSVKPGDVVELYGVGFGPTNPAIPAGALAARRVVRNGLTSKSDHDPHQRHPRHSCVRRHHRSRNVPDQSHDSGRRGIRRSVDRRYGGGHADTERDLDLSSIGAHRGTHRDEHAPA